MRSAVAEPPADLGERHEDVQTELGVDRARFVAGSVALDGSRATAAFTARLHLSGLGDWTYRGELALARSGGDWLVDWSPAAIHPALTAGWTLRRSRTWPERAPILAEDGTPLAAQRPVIVVGVEPRRIRNRRALFAALARFAGADPDDVKAELARPEVEPDWFVPVAELRPERVFSHAAS